MALNAELRVKVAVRQSVASVFGGRFFAPTLEKYVAFTSGTGANHADIFWADRRTLSASASENLDLVGVLTDAFGATIMASEVVAIIVIADASNANDVVLGNASHPIPLFGGTAPTLSVKPGGFFLAAAPAAGGIVTVGATHDLKVTNSGGSTGVTYDIAILGRSALNPLQAANVIFIGASIEDRGLSSAAEQAWVATVATKLGFAGTIRERAVEGHNFAQTIALLPAVLGEFSATAAQNVYVMHRSGNDVTNNRPYGAEEHDGYLANLQTIKQMIEAEGSSCIFANITYRPYDTAPAVDPHSGLPDLDGSGEYNIQVVDPFIRTFNGLWWNAENDAPVVDLYGFTRDNIGLIIDRVHFINAQEDIIYEYCLMKIAERSRPRLITDMNGRSIFLNVAHNGTHRVRTGNMNWHSWCTGYVVDMDGDLLPGVSIEWRGFSATAVNGAGTAAEARIADTRFHGLDASVLTQQTFVSSVANLSKVRQTWGEVRIHGLEPGQTGTLTMVGTRTGVTGTDRRMVVTTDGGATTATLDASPSAASNQIVLGFVVPSTGTLVVRGDIAAASVFGYFDAAILDFD